MDEVLRAKIQIAVNHTVLSMVWNMVEAGLSINEATGMITHAINETYILRTGDESDAETVGDVVRRARDERGQAEAWLEATHGPQEAQQPPVVRGERVEGSGAARPFDNEAL